MGPTERAGRKEWIALGVLALPLLLVSMDVSALYFAVPYISADLGVSATEQLWIFDIYGFVLAGLLITMGSLGDRIGRRRMFAAGIAVFTGASLLCGIAPSAGALIGARFLQGIAGTLELFHLSMVRFQNAVGEATGNPVGVYQRVDQAGGVVRQRGRQVVVPLARELLAGLRPVGQQIAQLVQRELG